MMSTYNKSTYQEEFGEEVVKDAEHVAHKMAHGVQDIAKDVEHGAKKVAHGVDDVAKDLAHVQIKLFMRRLMALKTLQKILRTELKK